MTNESTINKLIEMRLTAMADAFRIQKDDSSMKDVPFEDRFGMLVDIEYTSRKNNRLKRLIRKADFEQPDASVAAIDYPSGKSSTIFCSQFREEDWYQQLCGGESTLADAIMDRISYDSYKIDIESTDPSKDISMRELYGLDPEKAR